MHTDTPLPRKEGSNLVSEGEERKKRGPKGMKSVRDYSRVGDVETFCGCGPDQIRMNGGEGLGELKPLIPLKKMREEIDQEIAKGVIAASKECVWQTSLASRLRCSR